MAELARNSNEAQTPTAQLLAAAAPQVATAAKQSIVSLKTLPSLVVREVSRLFTDAIYGKGLLGKNVSNRGSDSKSKDKLTSEGSLVAVVTNADSRESSQRPEQLVEQRHKDSERESQYHAERTEVLLNRNPRLASQPQQVQIKNKQEKSQDGSWGLQHALERINEAINRVAQSDTDDVADCGEIVLGDDHHFTVVEVEDEENGFRKFTMFAEDDDLMLEPWQFRFSDSVMQIEIFVRDQKQLPMMMKQAPKFEESLAQSTGLKVVLSFYCPVNAK
jgi:hypothetical protein